MCLCMYPSPYMLILHTHSASVSLHLPWAGSFLVLSVCTSLSLLDPVSALCTYSQPCEASISQSLSLGCSEDEKGVNLL